MPESSPLLSHPQNETLSPTNRPQNQDPKPWSIPSLILLTITAGGLQVAWSVQLSTTSPYLLSLGLSKSLMALIWIAGPLTGVVVQPVVGGLSDRCGCRWGRRKPFVVGGAVGTVFWLGVLGWAREVGWFLGRLVWGLGGRDGGAGDGGEGEEAVMMVVRWVAVLGVYGMDFAMNTVEAATRTFIVDCAPAGQQEAANAMASRLISVGNVLGYFAGYSDLPTRFPFLGNTQFQVLCAIASISLASTAALTTLTISEPNPLLEGGSSLPIAKKDTSLGPCGFFLHIFRSARNLPTQIRNVCAVQFFAWIGYFAPLFYGSVWIADIYAAPYLRDNPDMPPGEMDELYERGTRVAALALLGGALTIMATNFILPVLVTPTYDALEGAEEPGLESQGRWRRFVKKLAIPGFTLKRAWLLSLIPFSLGMFSTLFIQSVEAASVLMAMMGYTWALSTWAPFAVIGAEIRQGHMAAQTRKDLDDAMGAESADSDISREDAPLTASSAAADEAGVILGIHNVASTAPQVISTVASSIVFRIWQKPRGVPGDRSVATVLALSGVPGLIAAFLVLRVKDGTETIQDEGDSSAEVTTPDLT